MTEVITATILTHAQKRADAVALVVGERSWSWAQLAGEIKERSKLIDPTDQSLVTFDAPSQTDAALNGLARLHLGLPIIGTTSGSTAAAKRYRRSQQSWLASFAADQQEFAIESTDVVIAPGSLSHSLFSYALCHGLFVGAKTVLSESFRPDRVLQQIAEHRATVLYAVPTQLKLIMQSAEEKAGSLPSLRLLLSSGARWFAELTPALAALFPRAEIAEFYGASETSFISLARHTSDAHLPKGSVGKAFAGVQLKINESGAICVHSAGSFDGYVSDPPADFSEFTDADGRRWISVGDSGHIDGSGYVFLSGRQSRKIVTSGKNLYPEEVEQCLVTHPLIENAAVMGLANHLRGERLVAAIEPAANSEPPSRSALISFLRPLLEDYKIPREFVVVRDWPTTATGKTDFARLRELLENSAQSGAVGSDRPSTVDHS